MKSPLRMIITVFRFLLSALVIVCWGITGVTRASIASENSLAGNLPSEWDVNGIGDPSIQGFATDFSVNRGTTVQFKINTNASAYQIDIYRLGYYNGRGARKVATINPSASLPQTQPTFVTDPATGLVDCGNWAVSASWAVPATATSGVYIARPVRTDTSGASHIIFVVRDDAGASDFLFQTADTTWQAYNNYGGTNLYRYWSSPPFRAYKVSYNRPFNNRGATQFAERESFLFNSEYPMIRWMEANGYNVSYASGMDTDRRGSAALLTHKVFLSVGHDEYWSGQQRTNIEAARAGGVHLGFFSGNEMYWKTRWENSIAGASTPNRTLVCYKETISNAKVDPSAEWTGTWRDPRFSPPSDGGRPENAVTGQFWTVDAFRNDPMVISSNEGKARFWRNTTIATLADGQTAQLPTGVLGFEWNEVRDNGFLPPGLFRLSTTTFAVNGYMLNYGSTTGPGIATHSMTLYRHGSGALVFGSGTIQWPWGLDATHDFAGTPTDVRMQQATVNLFADMDVQPTTLQPGLVAATASTDTVAPTSVIQMTPGATLPAGYPATIFGTATDAGGGKPAGVEFSYDGGTTWHLATGGANWSGTWTPLESGPVTLKSRAVDDSGRIENPGPGVSATVVGGLINGSFESGFTGWTATGNVVFGLAYGVATDGDKIVAFNGGDLAPNGVISQTFATTAGQTYTLTLDQGVLAYNTNPQTLQVTVTGSGSLLSQSVTINGLGGGAISWAPRSFTFVANSASSTLTLTDQSATTGSLDMLLDKVRVIAATQPQVATPTFNPAGGTYSAGQSVTLSDTTPGAAIYYTTNGTTPTTSSAFYTTPITVAATTTIKALAVMPGWINSAVASAIYTIQAQATLPAAPASLAASSVSGTQINLAWVDNASNETGFKIERKTGAGGTYAQIATAGVNATTYANTGLTAGTTYFYRVRATNAIGDSAYSPEASATTPTVAPAAPSVLTATATSGSQINLTWVDNASDETGFKIERKTGAGGTYAQIATVGANVTTYSNTGLTLGTTYFYRVRATNAIGDSAYSPEASATTPAAAPAAPGGLAASSVSGTQINLAWADSATNETGFKIERKTGAGGTYSQIATVGANVTNFSNTGLTAGTTYFYRVRATNGSGDSAYSPEAVATTGIPAFRAATSKGAASGVLSLDIIKPIGTLQGNVMVASIAVRPSTATITAPSGWSLVRRINNATSSSNSLAIYRKVAGATEPTSYSWTFSASTGSVGGIQSFSGIDTVNPIDREAGQSTATSLTHAAPSVTTRYANDLIVASHSFASSATFTPPAGMTEAFEVASDAAPSTLGVAIQGNYQLQAATGATGTRTATASNDADSGNAHTLALKASATVTNTAPVANAQSVAVNEDGTLAINLTGSDADGNSLIFAAGSAANGTVSLAGAVATYTPAANYNGPDSFSFTVNDGTAVSTPAVVSITVTPVSDPLAAPSALTATAASASQINLAWVDNASDETGFKIERKTGAGGTYAQIATAGVNATTYANTGLTAGTTYFCRVRATNATGDSAYSPEASATTPTAAPAAPSALTATVASASQINLAWVDNASDETGFKIERKTGAGGTYAQIATAGVNATTYANTGLTAGTTYFYRVRATNATGDSAYSSEASATTPTAPPVGLTNGSFESNFTGWTVTGNTFIESTPYYIATNGVKLISFNGNSTSDVAPTGVLSQTFATTPGATYMLAFDMGATGTTADLQRLRVTVDGTGNLLTQDATKSSNGTFTSQWTANSHTFVADSTTTTLTFRDISTTTNGVDALLDNVVITTIAQATASLPVNESPPILSAQNVPLALLADDSGTFDLNTQKNVATATGTLAWSEESFPSPGLRVSGSTVFLDFTVPENRSVQVETSDNLKDWSLWDIPANNSVVLPAGPATFSGPAIGPNRFFRLRIQERIQER